MYRRILVPLDGSELAEKILPHASAVAKAIGAEVTLVTIVKHTLAGPGKVYLETLPEVVAERKAAVNAEAKIYLEKIQRELMEQDIAARCDTLEGDAAAAIIGYAEEMGIDLIAMATHGRS